MLGRGIMLVRYPAKYRDRLGEETIAIENDGKMLRMVVRGVEFAGRHTLDLKPTIDLASPQLAQFTLLPHRRLTAQRRQGNTVLVPETDHLLGSCVIEYDIPIPVVVGGEARERLLQVSTDLPPDLKLCLTLSLDGCEYRNSGESLYWEEGLMEIQAALPEGTYIKACFNCALSRYSPYGTDAFGDLMCYRDNKEALLAARHKGEFMAIMNTFTEYVQETYLCPEFQRRAPGKNAFG
jgi:hypothetical protein